MPMASGQGWMHTDCTSEVGMCVDRKRQQSCIVFSNQKDAAEYSQQNQHSSTTPGTRTPEIMPSTNHTPLRFVITSCIRQREDRV